MHIVLEVDGEPHDLWLVRTEGRVSLEADGATFEAAVERRGGALEVRLAQRVHRIEVLSPTQARIDGHLVEFRVASFAPGGAPGKHSEGTSGAARVRPPMPGRVVAVKVREGDRVTKGQTLFVLEAMKMQNEVGAPTDGRVSKVQALEGQAVDTTQVLVELEP